MRRRPWLSLTIGFGIAFLFDVPSRVLLGASAPVRAPAAYAFNLGQATTWRLTRVQLALQQLQGKCRLSGNKIFITNVPFEARAGQSGKVIVPTLAEASAESESACDLRAQADAGRSRAVAFEWKGLDPTRIQFRYRLATREEAADPWQRDLFLRQGFGRDGDLANVHRMVANCVDQGSEGWPWASKAIARCTLENGAGTLTLREE